jgi:hypothetical protein
LPINEHDTDSSKEPANSRNKKRATVSNFAAGSIVTKPVVTKPTVTKRATVSKFAGGSIVIKPAVTKRVKRNVVKQTVARRNVVSI